MDRTQFWPAHKKYDDCRKQAFDQRVAVYARREKGEWNGHLGGGAGYMTIKKGRLVFVVFQDPTPLGWKASREPASSSAPTWRSVKRVVLTERTVCELIARKVRASIPSASYRNTSC